MRQKVVLSAFLVAAAWFAFLFTGCGGSGTPISTLSNLTPARIIAGSTDFTLTISGTNFQTNTTVLFGSVPLVPNSVSKTQLIATVPASAVEKAGVINVAVSGGTPSSVLPFTVENPVPVLTSLSQESVLLNSTSVTLDLKGSNFVSTSTVQFGGQSLVPTSITSTKMTVAIPDSEATAAKILSVAVINPGPGGGISSATTFSVLNPVPVISALSLDNVLVNSEDFTLSLVGSGFIPGMKIEFGGVSLTPTEVTPTQASVLVPKGAVGKGAILDVAASNGGPGGGRSNAMRFTVNNPVPVIQSISVTKAPLNGEGFTMDVAGSGFVEGMTIQFGQLVLVPTSITPTQVSIAVPKDALRKSGIYSILASNAGPGGGNSNGMEFSVENPSPVLTSLSLDKTGAGSADFSLILSGSQFLDTSKVSFGTLQLTPNAYSGTELTVTVPASALIDAGSYPVLVSNDRPGGGPSNALPFVVENPAPTLSDLSQKNAEVGDEPFTLTVTGSGFVHQSQLLFGGTPLTPSGYSTTSLSVLIPTTVLTKAGPVMISVANPAPGGGTSEEMRLSVANPVPKINSVTPTSLTAKGSDATVTLQGRGFVEGTTVTLGTQTQKPDSFQFNSMSVTISKDQLTSAGTLTLSVTSPEPGGGPSNTVNLVVHGKATSDWHTVVNNKMTAPNTTQLFNSYNQPSVNKNGVVVFKGQTKADSGPTVGIYVRNMSGEGQPLQMVAKKDMTVPAPNNTQYNGVDAAFIQFPSFPRIDSDTDAVAVRGQSRPVWTNSDGTRLGSAGVYINPHSTNPETAADPQKSLVSGLTLLGTVPEYSYFQVPGEPTVTRFDQFPGSPAVTTVAGDPTIVFKGNFTVGDTGKTGVFFRKIVGENQAAVELIADTNTLIPGQPEGGTTFGSTAPPSAANGTMVFVGLDNEDAPTLGGIYSAPITPSPTLDTIISIGGQVPGEADGVTFNRLGEGLSFDGRFVGFWGAWGSETRPRTLICGVDGNKEMLASCKAMFPDGYVAQIPLNQGLFVYDMETNKLIPVAKTNSGEFSDFMYWVFSGRPPNTGGGSGDMGEGGEGGVGEDVVPEPPRWRSSSFISVSGGQMGTFEVAFKAMTGTVDGVYLADGDAASDTAAVKPIQTFIDTTFNGTDLDPQAPAGSSISTVGMERDGLRSNWLAVTSSMLDPVTSESGAGIYITTVTPQ